jgi:hypothetical protein
MLSDSEFQRFKTTLHNFITFQMSMFDEALTKVFGELGAAMSAAFGGDPDEVRKEVNENMTGEVEASVKEVRDSITEDPDAAVEVKENCPPEHLQKLFDHVAAYDVGLPAFDTELSDKDMAAYIAFAMAGHERVGALLEGIGEWMEKTQAMLGGDDAFDDDDEDGDGSEAAAMRSKVDEVYDAAGAGDAATPEQLIGGMEKLGARRRETIDMLGIAFKAGGDRDNPVSRDAMLEAIMSFGPGDKLPVNESQLQTLIAWDFETGWKELAGGKDAIPVADLKEQDFEDDELKEMDSKGDGVIDRDEMLQYWKAGLEADYDFEFTSS